MRQFSLKHSCAEVVALSIIHSQDVVLRVDVNHQVQDVVKVSGYYRQT